MQCGPKGEINIREQSRNQYENFQISHVVCSISAKNRVYNWCHPRILKSGISFYFNLLSFIVNSCHTEELYGSTTAPFLPPYSFTVTANDSKSLWLNAFWAVKTMRFTWNFRNLAFKGRRIIICSNDQSIVKLTFISIHIISSCIILEIDPLRWSGPCENSEFTQMVLPDRFGAYWIAIRSNVLLNLKCPRSSWKM